MGALLGITIAAVLGAVVATLIAWLWPVRSDRRLATSRLAALSVAAVASTLAMSQVGRELGMPEAVAAAAVYFALAATGLFVGVKRAR